ncbi:hypothetical protein BG005_006688 [Podila minutissima]|nr:hypothetical protein BG005_006688 [Podila minutissima]
MQQVAINLSNNNFGEISPKEHVECIDRLKNVGKRSAEDDDDDAVARKGKYSSFGKRRIDEHTFDPPMVTSLAVIDAGDVVASNPIRGGIFRLRRISSRRKVAVLPPDDSNESEEDLDEEEFDEDEYMDRGYHVQLARSATPPSTGIFAL